MITSQYIMILALACIALTWAIVWTTGRRSPATQRIFAALTLQSIAAILLTFSSSLILSLALAAVILGAIAWMIHFTARKSPPGSAPVPAAPFGVPPNLF